MPKTNKDHQKIMKLEGEIKNNDSKERALNRKIVELRFTLVCKKMAHVQKMTHEIFFLKNKFSYSNSRFK